MTEKMELYQPGPACNVKKCVWWDSAEDLNCRQKQTPADCPEYKVCNTHQDPPVIPEDGGSVRKTEKIVPWFNEIRGPEPDQLDMVNHPAHYGRYGIEVIDMIRSVLGKDGFRAYCLGNIIKYRMRAGVKGDAAEDIAKAEKYLEFMEAAE